MIEAIHSIKFKNRNDAFDVPEPSLSVTMVHGGTKENIIPDRCEIVLDRRMIPGETRETVMAELKEVIDTILQQEKDLRIELKVRPNHWDPYLISENEPIVQALLEAAKEVTGKNRKPEQRRVARTAPTSSIWEEYRRFSLGRGMSTWPSGRRMGND